MLSSLVIKNIVLIDHLVIDFSEGLSALTGETGAGKSILLDSLGLALGARADAGLVRHGTDQASVIASFDLPDDHVLKNFLQEHDIEFDPNFILRRSLNSEGRSKAFINDQPVSITLLKKVGMMLVEIHGQFDTQSLLDPAHHIEMLDAYIDQPEKYTHLRQRWQEWRNSEKKLKVMRDQMDQARSDEEYYRLSLEDLDALAPEKGEEEKLSLLKNTLMRREQILENLTISQKGIEEIEAISANVWRALDKLQEEGKSAIAAMDRANVEIQEVLGALQDLSHDIDNSVYSLEEIDERLFALKGQARKHGCEIDALQEKRDEIAQALNAIENEDYALSSLIKDVEAKKEFYKILAEEISNQRQQISVKLAKLVMQELVPLKLEKARFEVRVEPVPETQWTARGINNVEFLVATNPGAKAGPINKIASGGELSRFMLALKVILAEVGIAGSLVFDEVDSGIGGATAAAVGQRLSRLAQSRQVLVVTHSPQVAAMADHHWIVKKQGDKKITTTIVPLKQNSERQEEIARMLSGAEVTQEARAAALKLLETPSLNKSVA